MKRLYRLTGELTDKETGNTPQELLKDGRLVRKPQLMANMLINYYQEKIEKLIAKIPLSMRNPHRYLDRAMESWEEKDNRTVFKFKLISLSETMKLIIDMGNLAAMGHDKIDAQGIKAAASQLVKPKQHIINTPLSKRKFAAKWKLSRLTLRLKSKDSNRFEVSAYQPVTVLPSLSKLVERVPQSQLLNFLETTGQMNPSSHAYRSSYSTMTTLCEILDRIYQGAEDKAMTSVMALDQSTAFDTVWEAAPKKKRTNFGNFPKGGGQGPIQSKRSTFCHIQVPTRISFILPHIHGGASLFIPHKFYP